MVPSLASFIVYSHIIGEFSSVFRVIFGWLMGLFTSLASATLLVIGMTLAGSPVNYQGFWSRVFEIKPIQKDVI
ncbi:hypothetical protein J2P12_02580 [Candidatus Bathyarchaeota archaeon]|nr:hypothetical protein [Candidatus Bathyarchaeota archaeon]